MAVLNIRAHRMAAVVVASLLSSTAIASAAPKVVIVGCNIFVAPPVIGSCDKSAGVVASCPATGTSCAQAVAVFESAPDNLLLINVSYTSLGLLVYTLGTPKID